MSAEFKKDAFFKIAPEPHLIGDMDHLAHFPGVQMWWKAIDGIRRPLLSGMPQAALLVDRASSAIVHPARTSAPPARPI